MSNECNNTLHITGPAEVLKRFVEDNLGEEGKPLTFMRTVPAPQDMEDSYTWCCDNWGTKRDVDYVVDLDESYEQEEVIYDFVTAWTPAIGWVKNVAKLYPELDFQLTYYETGCEFAGELSVWEAGNKVEHTEYGPEDDEYRELAGIEEEEE